MLPEFLPMFGSPAPEPGCEGAWIWRTSDAANAGDSLSDEEHERVAKLVTADARDRLCRYLVQRKQLLARLLDCPPSDVRIAHRPDGKPFLPHFLDIEFSLSDSEGWNGLALSRSAPLGIDLEHVRPMSWEPMLAMISDTEEAEAIRRAAGEASDAIAFFRCWTAKEAVLKAAGTGMRGDARRVRLPPDVIQGRENSLQITKDRVTFRVDLAETGSAVIARAVQT